MEREGEREGGEKRKGKKDGKRGIDGRREMEREREGARFGGSRIRARPLPPPHTRTYVHVARTCKYIAVE